MAMRVITDSLPNCYHALGVIHSRWTPIAERFHDYVATPKSNMYRSLHTTVVGPGGRRYEIQIRTEEMHRTGEYGIAAHWRYKESLHGQPRGDDEVDEALNWFRQVLEWQQDASEPEEFMEFLRMDLFPGGDLRLHAQGDVKQLPTGSTPIDFAFAVHTEVGLHCAGAKVNGRIAPLSRKLKNGDTVEVMTSAETEAQPGLAGLREDLPGPAADPPMDPKGGIRFGGGAGEGDPGTGRPEGQKGPARGGSLEGGLRHPGLPGRRLPP